MKRDIESENETDEITESWHSEQIQNVQNEIVSENQNQVDFVERELNEAEESVA